MSNWRLSNLSLTLRLTLLFATAATGVLLLLGYWLAHTVEQHFVAMDRHFLHEQAHQAEHHFAEGKRAAIVGEMLAHHEGLRLAIYAAGGSLLYHSPNSETANLPMNLLWDEWQDQTGQSWRGLGIELAATAEHPPLKLVLAMNIDHHQHFMHSFQHTLILGVVFAALFCGVLAWVAARQGLAPLQGIRQAVAKISSQDLATRLPTTQIPPELTELVDTLNAMLARLDEAFRRLSDFSSDLAHELRTPVSNLLTQTQVTLAYPRPSRDYQEILASNAEELERLSRMIADMLFLAKAEHGLLIAQGVAVDLAAELRNLLAFYEILAEEKRVTLRLKPPPIPCTILGDALMLRRAFSNLLSNALRYTPSGGKVEVSLTTGENQLYLCVENTGHPIPPEHLPRLFDRFYRVDTARQHHTLDQATEEGSGLGLAITRSIVLAHQGEITAESDQESTRFRIRLPY